jgi:hypothetical protein
VTDAGAAHINQPGSRVKPLRILRAQYGIEGKWTDVTPQVAGAVNNDQLWLRVSNSLFGDPVPGRVKTLKIDYSVGSVTATIRFSEGELAALNTTGTKKLGIFYTTNAIKPSIIQQSLASIKKATEHTPADILVSTWSPVKDLHRRLPAGISGSYLERAVAPAHHAPSGGHFPLRGGFAPSAARQRAKCGAV